MAADVSVRCTWAGHEHSAVTGNGSTGTTTTTTATAATTTAAATTATAAAATTTTATTAAAATTTTAAAAAAVPASESGRCVVVPRPSEAAVWQSARHLQRFPGHHEGIQVAEVSHHLRSFRHRNVPIATPALYDYWITIA